MGDAGAPSGCNPGSRRWALRRVPRQTIHAGCRMDRRSPRAEAGRKIRGQGPTDGVRPARCGSDPVLAGSDPVLALAVSRRDQAHEGLQGAGRLGQGLQGWPLARSRLLACGPRGTPARSRTCGGRGGRRSRSLAERRRRCRSRPARRPRSGRAGRAPAERACGVDAAAPRRRRRSRRPPEAPSSAPVLRREVRSRPAASSASSGRTSRYWPPIMPEQPRRPTRARAAPPRDAASGPAWWSHTSAKAWLRSASPASTAMSSP